MSKVMKIKRDKWAVYVSQVNFIQRIILKHRGYVHIKKTYKGYKDELNTYEWFQKAHPRLKHLSEK